MSFKTKFIIFLILFLLLSLFLNFFLYQERIFLKDTLSIFKRENKNLENNLKNLSLSLSHYLKIVENECGKIPPDNYLLLSKCLEKLSVKFKEKPNLSQIAFKNPKNGRLGKIVFINLSKRPLDSENFKLFRNNILVDQGCKIKGKIKPNYPCELNFYQKCEEGDVLEVFYKETSIAIINQFPDD